jgi:hypothetical protein
MIHAKHNDLIVGEFAPSNDNTFKTIRCENPMDTATHTNTSPKKVVTLEWIPPSDFEGTVIFK